jgi:hypothetical protein
LPSRNGHLFTDLTELCSKIEEVNISVGNQKLQISVIFLDGLQVNPPDPLLHNVYRVTLKNGEIWAIDTTGAQYGYADPLYPWHDLEHRSVTTNRELNFGDIRHHIYPAYETFPSRHMVTEKIEKEELTRAIEEKIPELAQQHRGKLSFILKGSDSAFEQAKNRFLDQLEGHIRASVARLHTPEQITRRNNKVDSQLAKNARDPDGQRKLIDLIRFVAPSVRIRI